MTKLVIHLILVNFKFCLIHRDNLINKAKLFIILSGCLELLKKTMHTF